MSHRIFLLSPAYSGGERAKMLLNPAAQFVMAQKVRRGEATLGEVFAFLSGLYFRGKMAYTSAFAQPPGRVAGGWVITTNQGLLPSSTLADLAMLQSFSTVPIDAENPAYRVPLEKTAEALRKRIKPACEVVLLGSVATGKYVDLLLNIFGDKLLFPADFVGRGDMSRGGLMLRSAAAGEELDYIPVLGAVRKGKRAAKLPPR